MRSIYLFATTPHKDAISIKSLDMEFLTPNINFGDYDYIIITSKHAITALGAYEKSEYINKPFLCVSPKTASLYEEHGGVVLEAGNGYGDDLVLNIQKYPKTTRWLYLRAELIVSSFVDASRDLGYNIDEAVLYRSFCSKAMEDLRVSDDSTLIFTSPSSIECFLKNNTISPDAKVVVIGTVTAKYLPKGVKYVVSETTTIDSCLEAAY